MRYKTNAGEVAGREGRKGGKMNIEEISKRLILLLGLGLIAALVFHGLAGRYDIVAAELRAYRIDRLTGRVSFCQGVMGCYEIPEKRLPN